MSKHALNTYLEPEQKTRLERMAARRKVSQATIVREAIDEYIRHHDLDASLAEPQEAWDRLLGGYFAGDGAANDHDDIYR